MQKIYFMYSNKHKLNMKEEGQLMHIFWLFEMLQKFYFTRSSLLNYKRWPSLNTNDISTRLTPSPKFEGTFLNLRSVIPLKFPIANLSWQPMDWWPGIRRSHLLSSWAIDKDRIEPQLPDVEITDN